MRKKLVSVITCTLIAPMFLNGNVHSVYADSKTNKVQTIQENQKDEVDRNGLMGYYFKGKDFNNLIMFAPTRGNTLMYDQQTADTLLDKQQQEYHSIRWIGLIKSKESGDFTFNLSDDENAIIEIDGKMVSQKGKEKQVVHLEKGQLVPIKIEYQSNETLIRDSQSLKNISLFKVDNQKHSHQVQSEELRNPEFNKKETMNLLTKTTKTNLFTQVTKEEIDEDTDTDGDAIPDVWEENGYTIQRKVAVKWQDSLAEKGYQKYVSNPYEAHTVGDPYTDYEKAATDIPLANAKETFNPLVAAFPSVNAGLEKVVIAKNEDMSHGVGSRTSNNWSYTNTEGASIEAGIGPKGISFGVSANYQHAETVAKEWGSSTEDTSHINGAQSAFLNANVRYQNVGTGAIYDVKPTTSFVLDGTTIGTIKAKENTTALSLSPGDSYPTRGQNGIAINTMDDFNSHPIPLNKEQLGTYMSNKKPILMETNQTEGKYAIKDTSGQIVISGDWNGIQQQVENKTASIMVNTGEEVSEKKVAGKDYTNPEDLTPEITLKEALKLAYPEEIKEKDNLLYYKDKPIYESSVMAYLDENTAKEVKKQINDTSGTFKDVNHLYDIKLTPRMNFTIKLATLYDGAENDSIGTWYMTYRVSGGNTGKSQFRSAHPSAQVVLNSEAKNRLNKNSMYYISLYMKADSDTQPIIEVNGEKSTISSKKVNLNSKEYQRVDILVDNLEGNPIKSVYVRGNDKTNVYWDDVAFTEVGASEDVNKAFSDEEIRAKYADFNIIRGGNDREFINAIVFKNIKPLQDYVKQYRVVHRSTPLHTDLDQTRDSYPVDNNGSVKVNFLEYNSGIGFWIGKTFDIKIYAITNDGRSVLVFSK
ncbi:PA14 domain-containing protein [Bacillus cereus]|nr:PA14 domain-containing protein [Bacillus cereus]